MAFAENTSVPVAQSRAELEGILSRAGATQRAVMSDDEKGFARVVFRIAGRHVGLTIPLPAREPFMTAERPKGTSSDWGSPEKRHKRWEQACRARWRAMVLLVKAKLESIELGISTIEREFLSDIYLSDGRTVHEAIRGDIANNYLTGNMPPLLGPAGREP